jgi:hypothetical protein
LPLPLPLFCILPSLVSRCRVLSCLTVCCLVVSSCLVLYFLVVSQLASSCLTLVLYCLVLSYTALSCPVLSCLILSDLVLYCRLVFWVYLGFLELWSRLGLGKVSVRVRVRVGLCPTLYFFFISCSVASSGNSKTLRNTGYGHEVVS